MKTYKPLNIEPIQKRFKNAELSPWRKVRGTYGWSVVEPMGAFGMSDVLIGSYLDGYTADFLAHVPDDMRALLREVERLRQRKRK